VHWTESPKIMTALPIIFKKISSLIHVLLSYDARSVFSLFSMKYMGSCPLNRKTIFICVLPVSIEQFPSVIILFHTKSYISNIFYIVLCQNSAAFSLCHFFPTKDWNTGGIVPDPTGGGGGGGTGAPPPHIYTGGLETVSVWALCNLDRYLHSNHSEQCVNRSDEFVRVRTDKRWQDRYNNSLILMNLPFN